MAGTLDPRHNLRRVSDIWVFNPRITPRLPLTPSLDRLSIPIPWKNVILTPRIDRIYRDIFALEFMDEHPSILLAGGRPGHLSVKDVRDRNDDTRNMSKRLGSPITHIKSLNEHNVVVSGLKNAMAVYDVRMLRSSTNNNSNNNNNSRANRRHPTLAHVMPVVQFPDYRNGPHIQIGLDVDREKGIVVAAHDDGKVAVYSTKTGHRLQSPDIDQIRSHRGVIQSLQFETMPRDNHPTLFVGNGSNLHTYSFGVRNLDDEA